jgi:hypothetical protein
LLRQKMGMSTDNQYSSSAYTSSSVFFRPGRPGFVSNPIQEKYA